MEDEELRPAVVTVRRNSNEEVDGDATEAAAVKREDEEFGGWRLWWWCIGKAALRDVAGGR